MNQSAKGLWKTLPDHHQGAPTIMLAVWEQGKGHIGLLLQDDKLMVSVKRPSQPRAPRGC